jgi:integrase-like protein
VAITPKVGRIRFEEAAADVLTDYRTNRKPSLDDVERRIELHLKPFFGNRRMASITTADIRESIDSRQKETTVRERHSPSPHGTARLDMCQSNGERSPVSRTPRSTASWRHSSACSTS